MIGLSYLVGPQMNGNLRLTRDFLGGHFQGVPKEGSHLGEYRNFRVSENYICSFIIIENGVKTTFYA